MAKPPDLLPLALAAIDLPDARIVLSDALEESGWWDPRVIVNFAAMGTGYARDPAHLRHMLREHPAWAFTASLGIACVLLFGDWSTEPWPLPQRCERGR